jgi:phosphatidylserine decarboxylase
MSEASSLRPSAGTSVLADPKGSFLAVLLMLGGIAVLVCGASMAGWTLVGLGLITLVYFRQPARSVFRDVEAVVSPVDGSVEAVSVSDSLEIVLRCPVTAVRTVRAPADSTIARAPSGSTVELETGLGTIALSLPSAATGMLDLGAAIPQGGTLGAIPVGRRVTVTLPANFEPRARPKDRIRGGVTVLARAPACEAPPRT